MDNQLVKSVVSRNGESKFDILFNREKNIYEVIIYRKIYEEFLDEERWERVNSTVIFSDNLERAEEIGAGEIRSNNSFIG